MRLSSWLLVFCFFTIPLSAFQKNFLKNPKMETRQEVLPHSFSYFEHLYFKGESNTFFSVGKKIDLRKAVYLSEKRGYEWKAYKKIPSQHAESGCNYVPGATVLLLERRGTPNQFSHLFHLLEHLIGIWNFGGEKLRDEVSLFLIAGNGSKKKPENWKGANQSTIHMIKALFPRAEIILWKEFVKETEEDLLCFEKVLVSDRCMEYLNPDYAKTERMMGAYVDSLTKPSLDALREAVCTYAGKVEKSSNKRIVTYVTRTPPRCLPPEVEEKLFTKIRELENVELRVVDFAKLSFVEQVKVAAVTDILIGVHGNGLSHTLFLPEGASLIEIFPEDVLRVEYRFFARARGLGYFGYIPNRGWIQDEEADAIGVFGDVNAPVRNVNVDALISTLKLCL